MNIILLLGSIVGLSSVMMAAYIDHSLALQLSGKSLGSVITAIRYHQLYAVVITMLGLYLSLQTDNKIKRWISRAGYIFSVGVLMFSFSIYISAMFNVMAILYFVPVGGLLFMLGWCCIGCASISYHD